MNTSEFVAEALRRKFEENESPTRKEFSRRIDHYPTAGVGSMPPRYVE